MTEWINPKTNTDPTPAMLSLIGMFAFYPGAPDTWFKFVGFAFNDHHILTEAYDRRSAEPKYLKVIDTDTISQMWLFDDQQWMLNARDTQMGVARRKSWSA